MLNIMVVLDFWMGHRIIVGKHHRGGATPVRPESKATDGARM
jgi:hypothetical protein